MNPLQSLRDYEQFIYTLQQRHSGIQRTTLTVFCRGAGVARLAGEVEIGNYRLVVREKVSFAGHSGKIIRRIHTISILPPTSSIIVYPRRGFRLPNPICRF